MNNYEINKELINTIVKKLRSYGTIKPFFNSYKNVCYICNKNPAQVDPVEHNISFNRSEYWSLRKKAFSIIRKEIKKTGKIDDIINTENKSFLYSRIILTGLPLELFLIYSIEHYCCKICSDTFSKKFDEALSQISLLELLDI